MQNASSIIPCIIFLKSFSEGKKINRFEFVFIYLFHVMAFIDYRAYCTYFENCCFGNNSAIVKNFYKTKDYLKTSFFFALSNFKGKRVRILLICIYACLRFSELLNAFYTPLLYILLQIFNESKKF